MIIDAHAHYEPRMLAIDTLLAKMDRAGVDRIALIAPMNDPLPETPEASMRIFRALMCRRSTRRVAEAIHRATLTPEGDLKLRSKVFRMYSRPDNQPVARLVSEHPERLMGWVFVNPRNNPTMVDELERWCERPGMIGLKLHPHWHDYRTTPEIVGPLLDRCEELGLPLLIHLGFRRRGDFRSILEAHPRLTVIAAHAGFPHFADLWCFGRRYPNLHVDLSSPYLDERLLRAAVHVMGAERCLYGTDSPYGFHGADGTYDYDMIKTWIERLPASSREIDVIFGGNFLRVVGDARRTS